jgi:hypothetical protein
LASAAVLLDAPCRPNNILDGIDRYAGLPSLQLPRATLDPWRLATRPPPIPRRPPAQPSPRYRPASPSLLSCSSAPTRTARSRLLRRCCSAGRAAGLSASRRRRCRCSGGSWCGSRLGPKPDPLQLWAPQTPNAAPVMDLSALFRSSFPLADLIQPARHAPAFPLRCSCCCSTTTPRPAPICCGQTSRWAPSVQV